MKKTQTRLVALLAAGVLALSGGIYAVSGELLDSGADAVEEYFTLDDYFDVEEEDVYEDIESFPDVMIVDEDGSISYDAEEEAFALDDDEAEFSGEGVVVDDEADDAFWLDGDLLSDDSESKDSRLPAPTGFTVKASEASMIDITWNKVSGATGYRVYMKIGKNGEWKTIANNDSTKNWKTAKNLSLGKNYYFRVSALKGDRVGYATKEVLCKTKLISPKGVKVISKSFQSVTVSWLASEQATGYYVDMATSQNGTYKRVAIVKGHDNTSAVVAGLILNKKYYFKIKAFWNNGKIKSSYSSPIRVGSPHERAIAINSITRPTSNSVKITWNKLGGAGSYQIWRATGASSTSFKQVHAVGGSTTSYTDKNLTKGQTYRYKVRAHYTVNGTSINGAFTPIRNITLTVAQPTAKYKALLVGQKNYSGSNYLPGPDNDVYFMSKLYTQSKNNYTVTKKNDLSASAILSSIQSAFAGQTANDVSLFYYSGHGVVTYDYDATDSYNGALCGIDGGYVTMGTLASYLKNVPGKVIVILDSCGSGAAIAQSGEEGSESVEFYDPEIFAQTVENAFAGVDELLYETADGAVLSEGDLTDDLADSVEYGDLAVYNKFYVITGCKATEVSWSIGIGGGESAGLLTYCLAGAAGVDYMTGAYDGRMPGDYSGNGRISLAEFHKYANLYADGDQTICIYPKGSTYEFFNRK